MSEAEPAIEQTIVLSEDAELDNLARVAADNGWPVAYTNYCSHGEYEQILWTTPSGGTRARYLEHHTTGTRCVSVYGDNADEVNQVVETVSAAVTPSTVDEILDELLADESPAPVAIVRGFRRLAIAHYVTRVHAHSAGPLDPRYVQAVERHVAHPHRQVRLSVMLVADELSTLWPELTAPIIARQGIETEHADLVAAFVELAQDRKGSSE